MLTNIFYKNKIVNEFIELKFHGTQISKIVYVYINMKNFQMNC